MNELKEDDYSNNYKVIQYFIEEKFIKDIVWLAKENNLAKLIKKFPNNDNLGEVSEKVRGIDILYGTRIKDYTDKANSWTYESYTEEIANVIIENKCLDLNLITMIRDKTTGKNLRSEYVFITKYCNWHYPRDFVIHDSKVRKALSNYFKNEIKNSDELKIDYLSYESYILRLIKRFDLIPTLKSIERDYKNRNEIFFKEFLVGYKLLDKYLYYFAENL